VPCYGQYHGLQEALVVEKLADVKGGLVAVYEGHVAVHEDDSVVAPFSQVNSNIVLDHLDRLLSAVGSVNLVSDVDSTLAAEDGLERIQVKVLIVDYEDLLNPLIFSRRF